MRVLLVVVDGEYMLECVVGDLVEDCFDFIEFVVFVVVDEVEKEFLLFFWKFDGRESVRGFGE